MPRIVDYSPPWLSRPSPGVDLFCPDVKDSLSSSIRNAQKAINDAAQEPRPVRTLARRGTEIFTVIDNQIRWADLARLKDEWRKGVKQKREESGRGSQNGKTNGVEKGRNGALERNTAREESEEQEDDAGLKASYYRILTTPVYGKIEQLAISPDGAFLAITTKHTVHIAILPDPSHLSGPDYSPLRVKTFQLGPTTHVIPESPVVAVLWHPLGICDTNCGCLVTVTSDSAVRLWEIDRKNQWSFDRPTLAIDLKKLVDGTSMDQDFAPLSFGQNKGFSADSFDMEVAAARFGGHGYEEEDAWAAMTLWVAMRTGDVYALCPLLPSKWQASPVTIPSLTSSIVRELTIAEEENSETDDGLKATQQQYEWLKEIDNQDALPIEEEGSMFTEIRVRPTNPSPIPRLQGPFLFDCEELEEDIDITDVYVIASRADLDDLMAGEDEPELLSEISHSGLSGTIICLLTSIGTLHVCLEMDGVKGQWLPRTCKNTFSTPMSEPSELLLLESLETVRAKDRQPNMWPMFSEDFASRYDFFVTTARTVSFFSLSSWVHRVEPELRSEDTSGSAFRINIICDGEIAEREQMLQLPPSDLTPNNKEEHLAGCLSIFDYELGYLLLSFSPSKPCAVLLDSPEYEEFIASREPSDSEGLDSRAPVPAHTRPPYQVPSILYSPSPLVSFVPDYVPHGHRHTLKEPVRLSPSTLELFTSAHRILSTYTHSLEVAASDLFRRCERLQGEMRGQLTQLVEIGERINDVSNGTVRGTVRRPPVDRGQALDSRLTAAQSRQKELVERYNNIRLKIIKAGGRPISEREKVWIKEVDTLSTSLGEDDGKAKGELQERLETATKLAKELLSEMKNIPDAADSTPSTPNTTHPKVPQRLQKAKVADAMNMVERESAVIDAITSRLERLSTSFPDL